MGSPMLTLRERQQLASRVRKQGRPEPVPSAVFHHPDPCRCGAKLSMYNPGELCARCQQRGAG